MQDEEEKEMDKFEEKKRKERRERGKGQNDYNNVRSDFQASRAMVRLFNERGTDAGSTTPHPMSLHRCWPLGPI